MDDTARMDKPPVTTITINPVKIGASEIPVSIKTKGKTDEAWKWNDNLGENILVISHVEPYDDKNKNEYGEEGQTSELYAYHFVKSSAGYSQLWMLKDGVQGCPFDITNNFIPGSTTITDLDKNGIAEIKLQYLTACRSDVSPAEVKLLLYENGVRHSLTGLSWLPYSPELKFNVTVNDLNLEKLPKLNDENEEYIRTFGRYQNEKDFASVPPAFLDYVRQEWLKFVKEKIGE